MRALASTAQPATDDGRNVDPSLGVLCGEGSTQITRHPEEAYPTPEEARRSIASARAASDAERPSYYGQPAIKDAPWTWAIPAYFYVGGVSGATSVLTAAAELVGARRLRRLAVRGRWIGATGDAVSAVLLIADLGRPARFLYMLRVFRPTSPMSVGSWVLSASGAANALAALLSRARRGPLSRLGDGASLVAGALGLPLAGYTATLIADTAVPIWQQGRRSLPLLFMSSAVASAADLLLLGRLNGVEARVARRFALAGKLGALAAGHLFERDVAHPDEVGAPLRRGASGAMWRAAKLLGAASLALLLWPAKQPRALRRASAVLGTLGAIATRFAVFHAGKASARDPQATFRQQRAGLGAAEVTRRGAQAEGGLIPAASLVRSARGEIGETAASA